MYSNCCSSYSYEPEIIKIGQSSHEMYSNNILNFLDNDRGCRYETIEEMKEAVTKVIDTLAQDEFHGAFQKLLERYNKCIAADGDYFEGD